MYRAQRLAEFALYDREPQLFDAELDHYLDVTAADIKSAVAKFLDVDNHVILDIVPANISEESSQSVSAAAPQPAGEPKQPAAPASQIPDAPRAEPESPKQPSVTPAPSTTTHPEPPKDPADVPNNVDTGSGPLHLKR
jgi:hypothetical protein